MSAALKSGEDAVQGVLQLLQDSRQVVLPNDSLLTLKQVGLLESVKEISTLLGKLDHHREAGALDDTLTHAITSPDFGGLGYSMNQNLTNVETAEVIFLVGAYLESLNSSDRQGSPLKPLQHRPTNRRGMTLTEKIFAAHDVDRRGEVKPGDVIRVNVDWVIASELSWAAMERTYDDLGKPGIFRNDRLWIAGDHVVDPRVQNHPKIKPLVEASERARQIFKMTENQGMNYTIMHTEFCRERAQPGMLVIGSDSHTCSAGSVSALAIGLGVADVTLPLVLGETWFRVPEIVEIRFIGKPKPGIGGKDVILYVLQQLKRNTVAAERVVEYTGPSVKYLSCDARFAISNMTTEFGGVSGIFIPDEITKQFIDRRKNPKHKKLSTYYRPDDDAQYAETHTIDLDNVEPFVALYPNPDDVVPVGEVLGKKLDGCFIGACTTTQEDLILGALVLEVGLKRGLKVTKGKRRVVPGSRPILHDLRARGFAAIYEQAGFEIGVPGCSYCVGMSADKAGEGEVWLSSQNRNFKNRMGPGSFGNLSSAITVASSSFSMTITDPKSFLDDIDLGRLESLLNVNSTISNPILFVEPGYEHSASDESRQGSISPSTSIVSTNGSSDIDLPIIKGKVQKLGDFIDTDALAPNEALAANIIDPEELGTYCLKYTHPEFRQYVKDGLNVVVAGKAFGVGSSRENAVTALQGAGVQAVIAKSFAFIYGRNQPNLGLLGFVITNEKFYERAKDGASIEIDILQRLVTVDGEAFPFSLSDLEWQLVRCGGMTNGFSRWGKELLQVMTGTTARKNVSPGGLDEDIKGKNLLW